MTKNGNGIQHLCQVFLLLLSREGCVTFNRFNLQTLGCRVGSYRPHNCFNITMSRSISGLGPRRRSNVIRPLDSCFLYDLPFPSLPFFLTSCRKQDSSMFEEMRKSSYGVRVVTSDPVHPGQIERTEKKI